MNPTQIALLASFFVPVAIFFVILLCSWVSSVRFDRKQLKKHGRHDCEYCKASQVAPNHYC